MITDRYPLSNYGGTITLNNNDTFVWNPQQGLIQKGTPMDYTDTEVISKLNNYRAARDEAVRLGEALNDEAALLEIQASRKRAQSALVFKQVNEDVPVPADVAPVGYETKPIKK